MPVPESILYLTEADVQQTVTIAEAVDLAEKGIQADAAGQVVGDKFYMTLGEAGFIKPFSGYLTGEELAFVKTFSFFPGNPERFGCPTTSSLVLLLSLHCQLLLEEGRNRSGFAGLLRLSKMLIQLRHSASSTALGEHPQCHLQLPLEIKRVGLLFGQVHQHCREFRIGRLSGHSHQRPTSATLGGAGILAA